MQAMANRLHTLLWIITGFVLTVLALELLLRALPVTGKGVYGAEFDPDWPMHHMLPDTHFTYSAGWNLENVHEGAINNMGYVAPFDFVAGSSGIVVLGDSYIESLMNDYDTTLQGRLRKAFDTQVMPFANSGGSMPDYLAVAKLISSRFKPEWGIILLTEGDFVEGFSYNKGYYSWDPGRDPPVKLIGTEQERSALVKWARQLALVRYLRYNLKVNVSRLIHAEPVLPAKPVAIECEPVTLSAQDTRLVDTFVKELPAAFGLDPSRVILIFDADRKTLYVPGPREKRCDTRDSVAQALVRSQARAQGMHVLETDPLFSDYYARTRQRVDYSPVDWHWNGEAHRLVAEKVAGIINGTERRD
jgi:hypothetical protein